MPLDANVMLALGRRNFHSNFVSYFQRVEMLRSRKFRPVRGSLLKLPEGILSTIGCVVKVPSLFASIQGEQEGNEMSLNTS